MGAEKWPVTSTVVEHEMPRVAENQVCPGVLTVKENETDEP